MLTKMYIRVFVEIPVDNLFSELILSVVTGVVK